MTKLTDEELSRILSQQAIGRLRHEVFSRESDGCGCIAGAALAIGGDIFGNGDHHDLPWRALQISAAVYPGWNSLDGYGKYPSTPEELLKMLADKGLA
jgi:hypothetical protein